MFKSNIKSKNISIKSDLKLCQRLVLQSPVSLLQIFHNLLIRNTSQSSIISFTNTPISAQRGHFIHSLWVEILSRITCQGGEKKQRGQGAMAASTSLSLDTLRPLQHIWQWWEGISLTRQTHVMQGLSVMLGMWRTSPSLSQLASVPIEDRRKVRCRRVKNDDDDVTQACIKYFCTTQRAMQSRKKFGFLLRQCGDIWYVLN